MTPSTYTVKDVLIRARKRIEKKRNWAQRTYVTERGLFFKHDAYCALGAIGTGVDSALYGRAYDALSGALDYEWSVSGFNDTHTHREVLAMFDRAIEVQS